MYVFVELMFTEHPRANIGGVVMDTINKLLYGAYFQAQAQIIASPPPKKNCFKEINKGQVIKGWWGEIQIGWIEQASLRRRLGK